MNKRILAKTSVLIACFFALGGCSLGQEKAEVSLNVVIPEDSDVAFELNFAEKGQVEKLKSLLAKFPKVNYLETQDYLALLKPFIGHDWELVGGVMVDEEGGLEEMTAELVIAGKFEKDDEFEEFVDKMIAKSGSTFEKSEGEGVDYWKNSVDEVYIARMDDVFMFANGEKQLEGAIGRWEEGNGGFEKNANFRAVGELGEERFGYYYVSENFLTQLVKETKGVEGPLGDAYGVFVAEEGGVRILGNQIFEDREAAEKLMGLGEERTDFLAKLPDQNVISFAQFSGLAEKISGYEDPVYAELIDALGDYEDLFNSPVAFVISDKDQLVPLVSLYFDIDGRDEDLAKDLLNKLDGYVEEVIAEFDVLIAGSGYEGLGLLKREVEVMDGEPIRKVYVDFSVMSEDVLNAARVYVPKLDFDSLKMEFYYGVNADGMLFFAYYPGLDQEGGKKLLSDNEVIMNGLASLKMKDPEVVSFFDFSPLFVIGDKYLEMFKESQFADSAQVAEAEKTYLEVKSFLEIFDYVVGGSRLEGDTVQSESYLEIGN